MNSIPRPSAMDLLEKRFARIAAVNGACGILSWDYQTMMPEGASEGRGEQMATLSVIAHEMLTAVEVGDWLAEAAEELEEARAKGEVVDPWRVANLREMKAAHAHATAVPADLVEATTKATTACEMVWRKARADSDFKALLPTLTTLLDRVRETAAAKATAFGLSPYDALLDEYDPGNRAERVDAVFGPLAEFLPGLIDQVIEHQAREAARGVEATAPAGPFPVEAQKALGVSMMERLGFDFTRGRLDVSLHPFSGGARDDNRLTTRYDEDDFMSSFMGVMHETGHGLYEQGLPRPWGGQPVGGSRGMTAHESQSLIVEMQAGRSDAFLGWFAPTAAAAFGRSGPEWSVENMRRLYRKVERSFIRVDADEVTYPAHVVLRYRLETAMISGDLALPDLPGAWNDGMRELLGVTPPDDRRGCLQDIHWPGGAFGYFPTYTLGAMSAAQLFDAARRDDPTVETALAEGSFAPLVDWLREKVHGRGCLHPSADALLAEATGRPLDPAVFKAHLERRYLGV